MLGQHLAQGSYLACSGASLCAWDHHFGGGVGWVPSMCCPSSAFYHEPHPCLPTLVVGFIQPSSAGAWTLVPAYQRRIPGPLWNSCLSQTGLCSQFPRHPHVSHGDSVPKWFLLMIWRPYLVGLQMCPHSLVLGGTLCGPCVVPDVGGIFTPWAVIAIFFLPGNFMSWRMTPGWGRDGRGWAPWRNQNSRILGVH